MGKALYRKYRSRSLEEVVGQPHVTELLGRALKQGRVAHAYLFTGPKGVGKTSIARILAHEINGLPYSEDSNHLDIIEIDAASNNGVDDIRDLREKVQIAPVSAAKKVYIIDEVHMLSKPAFNALLKTLEEPPEHVVFILATTDIDKVPETIVSRTQRYTFRRATLNDLVANLGRIAKAEKIHVAPQALELIALHSDGSFRDSVSIFDQLASLSDEKDGITGELAERAIGLASSERIETLLEATLRGNIGEITEQLATIEATGASGRTTVTQLLAALKPRLASQPELLPLLDALLEVPRSHNIELKLLTTLCLYVDKLQPSLEPQVKPASAAPKKPTAKPQVVSKPAPASEPKAGAKKVAHKGSFDWEKLLAYVRSHHVALHSVLAKCEPEVEGTTVTLYTKNPFYKKKLDDAKYRNLLAGSLQELGMSGFEIETNPGAPALKNSHAAKVAAIMGGGEEVSVDDTP